MDWHFAHDSGAECQAGYESALHLAVKQIIQRHRKLLLPDCIVRIDEHRSGGYSYHYHETDPGAELIAMFTGSAYGKVPGKMIEFDEVLVEQTEDALYVGLPSVRPDLIGRVGDAKLYIEVAVTHFVDDEKMRRIRTRGVSNIELG
jgi:competence protein CoiA